MLRNRKRMAVCITLLCVNLCFIWGNSLLPGEISGAISGWLRELLLGAAPEGPDVGHGLLRKLAHFTEFACLGALLIRPGSFGSAFAAAARTRMNSD